MNNELIIINDTVFLKEYKLTKSLHLNDLAKKLISTSANIETPILPANCIKYISTQKNNIYIIHLPEEFYSLKQDSKDYTVRLPNGIMIFVFNKISSNIVSSKLFWIKDEIVTLDDKQKLYIPPLQNIYSDGKICMGKYNIGKTQKETVENYIIAFFENKFNNDISNGKNKLDYISKIQHEKLNKQSNVHELIYEWWKNNYNMPNYFNKTFENIINPWLK